MDRTAWIVVILCVIGLLLWQVYVSKQVQPKAAVATSPNGAPLSPTPAFAVSTPAPLASPLPTATPPAEAGPAFQETIETLRNSDVELHLTNRGGGIAEAVLLNHKAEENKPVVLNSPDRLPIGAIVDNPAAPVLPEYKMTRQGDSVQFEYTTAERVIVRKKFLFQKSPEKKDNFVLELNVDLENGGAQPYVKSDYFVTLGSAVPTHPKDYPSYTRLAWCIDGRAKGVDVGWFGGGSGFLGLGQRAAQPFYQQSVAGAEWVAVSNQFFTTLFAPLGSKANGTWARRFDVTKWPEQKAFGIEGALGMPGFQLPPGQTYTAKFQNYAGPKI